MTQYARARVPVFYRANVSDLLTLHLVTLGFYDLYWGYRQWYAHQATHGRPIWPLMRSWLSVFYTHGLFRSIDARARAVGARATWRPNSQAWWFVGLTFVAAMAGRIFDDTAEAIALVFACHALRVFPMMAAQRLSNEAHALAWALVNEEAEDDDVADGEANDADEAVDDVEEEDDEGDDEDDESDDEDDSDDDDNAGKAK